MVKAETRAVVVAPRNKLSVLILYLKKKIKIVMIKYSLDLVNMK